MRLNILVMFLGSFLIVSLQASEKLHFPLSIENIRNLHQLQILESNLKDRYEESKADSTARKHYFLYLRSVYHRQQAILDPQNSDMHLQESLRISRNQTALLSSDNLEIKTMTPEISRAVDSMRQTEDLVKRLQDQMEQNFRKDA